MFKMYPNWSFIYQKEMNNEWNVHLIKLIHLAFNILILQRFHQPEAFLKFSLLYDMNLRHRISFNISTSSNLSGDIIFFFFCLGNKTNRTELRLLYFHYPVFQNKFRHFFFKSQLIRLV